MATIIERNGSYHIMVSGGYGADGKQIRHTKTWRPEPGMTKKQIKDGLNEQAVLFERKVRTGQLLDCNVTFAEFVERWKKDYAKPNLAPKTYERYEAMLKRILPAIGHIKLSKLQPNHLLNLYADMAGDINHRGLSFLATEELLATFRKSKMTKKELSEEIGCHVNTVYQLTNGKAVCLDVVQATCDILNVPFEKGSRLSKPTKVLSNKTIKHHHRLISSILNQAVFWQVLLSSPAQRVKPPKVDRTEAKYLDEIQTAHLLELLKNEPYQYQVMVKLLVYSGLRRGELCGLEWKDIDFKNQMITVCRSSQYVQGKGVFTKETKTTTSDRTIKLPAQAFDMLKEYRKWQQLERVKAGADWEEHDRIFTQSDGKPIHPDTVTGWFRDFINSTDLPYITIHSLRHTNITLLLAAGVPLRTVSYRAGHAQTSTTANIYSHAIRTADEMASDVLENILTVKKAQ